MKNNTRKQNAGVVSSFLISSMPLQAMVKQHEQLIEPWEKGYKQIERFTLPWQEVKQFIKGQAPLWICELALAAAEDGDTESLDIFTQKYLGLRPDEWPYAEEALRESLKYWRLAEEPFHYVQKVAHRKRKWIDLDVDHVSGGVFYPGSLYRKRKDSRNKSPNNILSLDVMLEMEGRRAENDKEAWLDNDGILENEQDGVIVTGEIDNHFQLEDPYKEDKGKKAQWIKEANYIQRKFIDGYYTETFSMKDEQEKFIMSSYIPRLKRKGVDPNLCYRIEERIDSNVDIETAIKRAKLRNDDFIVAKAWGLRPGEKYYDGAEWNQYRPGWFQVHMAAPDIATLLRWDEKRVNASMKRIKRAVKNKTLMARVGHFDDESLKQPEKVHQSRWLEMEKLLNYN